MPRNSSSKVKEELEIKSGEDLGGSNPIPIYTLSIRRGCSFFVRAKVPTGVRKQEPSVEACTRLAGVKRRPVSEAQSDLPVEIPTHTRKKPALGVISDDGDLDIYGDLSTAESAHKAVLRSLAEAIEAGEFEQKTSKTPV